MTEILFYRTKQFEWKVYGEKVNIFNERWYGYIGKIQYANQIKGFEFIPSFFMVAIRGNTMKKVSDFLLDLDKRYSL